MDLWLQALRKQIDGGRKASVTAKDVPRHWQVELVEDEKENKAPSSIDEGPKPIKEETSPITALPPVLERVSTPPPAAKRESYENDSDDSNRKGSLELLEEEADRLVAQPRNKTTDRRTSDAPSFTSTIAPSVDQQALNNLRNSVRNSHISTVTGMTSRTNSITSEPSSNKPSLESSADSGSVKSPYKSLSSYQSSKRRSALPTSAPGSQAVLASTIPTPAPGDSPLLGSMTSVATVTAANITPRVGAPRSPPTAAGSDNKIPDLPLKDSTPPIAEEDERPESFVADLPPPSTWNMKISPKKRASVGAPMTDRQLHRMSSAPTLQATINQASSNRRASQAFRIPLKVNPDNSASRPSPKSNPRASMLIDSPAAQPKVFTLEAKVDPSKRTSIQEAPGELRKRTSQRLSLFPSPLLTQNMFPEEQSRRPSLPGSTQINPDMVNARRASLQRPTSLQVRTSHAPFLSSVRNQTPSSTTSPTPTTRTSPSDSQIRAAPIRSLKPSRSASAISSLQSPSEQARSVSPTDPFQSARLPLAEEDEGIHIPPRRQSYISKRTPSPASAPPNAPLPLAPGMTMNNNFVQQRNLHRQSMKPRNSLMTPLLTVDLGIPVIGLGPPAPPPNAPLPAPPGGAPPGIVSRGTTPIPAMSPVARGPILPHSNALVPPQQRPMSSKAEGLGIRVG